MFNENPSMRSMIEGMMMKEGRTLGDFKALFGFDKIHTGLPFEMLQASTLIFVDNIGWYAPYDTDAIAYENGLKIFLTVEDYNNAKLTINAADTNYSIRYLYRTDNFPSIEVVITKKYNRPIIKHVQDLVPGCGIDQDTLIELTSVIIPYLSKLMYDAYLEKNK